MKIAPHRIDVQQGNALDQENVARLKPGLNRSQVRFLLGTPLVVDPFRTDRWDYVYVYYKAGKLAEQKRISLFFEGDTLARIEGDLPESVSQPVAPATEPRPEPRLEPQPAPATPEMRAPAPVPIVAAPPVPPAPVVQPAAIAPRTAVAPARPAPVVTPAAQAQKPVVEPASQQLAAGTSIVAPLPSPKSVPAYVDSRPPAELSLQAETDVAKIRPDTIPAFPEPHATPAGDTAPVLQSVNDWGAAWTRRDKAAYFAAYDNRFVPQEGVSRSEWQARKRLLLDVAKNIDVRIEAPRVERTEEGTVLVTFNQVYRSDGYSDAVVKQLHMVEHEGRWLIVEEKVLSVLRGARP